MSADTKYEPNVNISDSVGGDPKDDQEYLSSAGGGKEVPVQKDSDDVGDTIDPEQANSDAQLERDDADAIDKSNIVGERTRHARPGGGYREPGDEEGIPTDD